MIWQVFGLWLPPAKGRSGTPAVATKSWHKKKYKLNQFRKYASYKQPFNYIHFKLVNLVPCMNCKDEMSMNLFAVLVDVIFFFMLVVVAGKTYLFI